MLDRFAGEALGSFANTGKLDFRSFPHHARRKQSGVFHLLLAIDSKRAKLLDDQGHMAAVRPREPKANRPAT